LGATWTSVSDAPWSARMYAKLTADAENNLFLTGCQSGELCDIYYSWNKGVDWKLISPVTNAGYANPVIMALASDACVFITYTASSTAPQGYHRQLVMYSGGDMQVYAGSSQVTSTPGSFPQCACDTLNGVRAVTGDLIFQNEVITTNTNNNNNNNNNNGNSGSSSTSYSAGQTAGIAVGVGIGCLIIGAFIVCCIMGGFAGYNRNAKSTETDSMTGKSRQFQNEPSAVEMNRNTALESPTGEHPTV